MKKHVIAMYKASTEKKSSIKVETSALDIHLHQMVVWIMHNQEDAICLLPEYERLKKQKPFDARDAILGRDR